MVFLICILSILVGALTYHLCCPKNNLFKKEDKNYYDPEYSYKRSYTYYVTNEEIKALKIELNNLKDRVSVLENTNPGVENDDFY
jgi:hypothetical protein